MSIFVIAAIVELVTLHTIDGRIVLVNPKQVTQLREARPEGPNKQLHPDVTCVIRLTDGSYVTVAETCDVVKEIIEGERQ